MALVVAATAEKLKFFGRASRYVETVSYSATFLFHLIPAITETTTRLPVRSPLIVDREGPELMVASGLLILLFLVGATLQVRRLLAKKRQQNGIGEIPELISSRDWIPA